MCEFQQCSQNTTEVAKKLLEVQASLPRIEVDSVNPHFKSRYASLASVMDAVRPVLVSKGLLLVQSTLPAPAGYVNTLALETRIVDVASGQWVASLGLAPLSAPTPQGMGSTQTYLRRYGLMTLLGLTAAEDDDDGNLGSRPQAAKPKAREEQGSIPPSGVPRIQGARYSKTTGRDGRAYEIVTDVPQEQAQGLAKAGYRWDAQNSYFWRPAPSENRPSGPRFI